MENTFEITILNGNKVSIDIDKIFAIKHIQVGLPEENRWQWTIAIGEFENYVEFTMTEENVPQFVRDRFKYNKKQ